MIEAAGAWADVIREAGCVGVLGLAIVVAGWAFVQTRRNGKGT